MANKLRRLWWRLIGFETIDGNGACPVYLYRWRLFACPWWKVYLHHFVGDDWSIDPHDHPKAFTSIGLRGWYVEEVYNKDGARLASLEWRAPWFRRFPATHVHRIRAAHTGGCWTLVVVGKSAREWGFVRLDWLGQWIPWREYVDRHGEGRKSC